MYNKEDFSELFDKLEVFLDSVKDSKKSEVNMRCALKCTKEIFKKAGIPINEGELVIKQIAIFKKSKHCCRCICF